MLKALRAALPTLVACALLAGCATGPSRALDETVTLSAASPVQVAREPLSLQIVAVQDRRCASDVRCVWAGHATVAVQVRRQGASPHIVLLGTPSPPAMHLPGEANAGPYHLRLVDLTPANHSATPPSLLQYRARVQVTPASAS